jgi:WhiB family transcriptional regulator, redox-sensing transcriptional regulator
MVADHAFAYLNYDPRRFVRDNEALPQFKRSQQRVQVYEEANTPEIAFLRPEWHQYGLCNEPIYDPNWWFPKRGKPNVHLNKVKEICASCPVQPECLEYALMASNNPKGVWGGTSELDRKPMRREWAEARLIERRRQRWLKTCHEEMLHRKERLRAKRAGEGCCNPCTRFKHDLCWKDFCRCSCRSSSSQSSLEQAG